MSISQILYGVLDGELVHIDNVERGLACLCTCHECGRALVAKKGEVLRHHFAHNTDDVNCNPTAESLVHRYAKQQVSKLQELILPGFEVRAQIKLNDGQGHEIYWRHQPYYRLYIKSAEVEADLGSVRPDVLCITVDGRIAIEVYFRHQVPTDKIVKLQTEHYLSAVEIDLSDVPVDAPSGDINAAIAEPQRWAWLHNQHKSYLQARMSGPLARSTRIFVPARVCSEPKISINSLPSRKLAKATMLLPQAKKLVGDLLKQTSAARLQRVRGLQDELRIALHCTHIGLLPIHLPPHLMQAIEGQGALGVHPVIWETGIFAKFCIAGGEFTVNMVENWVRSSFGDKALFTSESLIQTTNGFSPGMEAIYHFLRNINRQGLLKEITGVKPWESRFAPIKPSKTEVLEMLLMRSPALELYSRPIKNSVQN